MAMYINGIGTISPQHTFGEVPFLESPKEFLENKLTCMEPDYNGWIEARAIRRMSKVIRIGVASAGMALKEAGLQKPDAIITGTAFGCLEDTGIFLTKMIDFKEEALNPTPFIQSTHNTIGSQVALLLQCLGYNQTYSHRAFSFENSLLDAQLTLEEQQANILVGGVDEVTDASFDIIKRFGLYKDRPMSNLTLFTDRSHGVQQGEGATYFMMSGERQASSYAKLTDLATLYKPEEAVEITAAISALLQKHSLSANDIDLVLLGKNGHRQQDDFYDSIAAEVFPSSATGVFKHLCGEYETASAFALWVAAKILKTGSVPATISTTTKNPRRILIYNQYLGSHHSFILLESC